MNNNRIHSLDLLKVLAAFVIIFHHYQQSFEVTYQHFNFYNGRIYFGLFVELFFIISGYLSVYRYFDKPCNLYVYKKLIRLMPMAFISTSFAYIACLIFWKQTGIMLTQSLSFLKYIGNCFLIVQNGIFGYNFTSINNPLWYLSVLFVLYIVLYFENRISKKIGMNTNIIYSIVLAIFMLTKLFRVELPIFNSLFARGAIPFSIGSLLVAVNSKLKEDSKYFLLPGLIIVSIIFTLGNFDLDTQQRILNYVLFPLLVLYCLQSNLIVAMSNNRIIEQLSKITFESYVWHAPLFYIVKIVNFYGNNFLPIQKGWFMIVITIFVFLWSTLVFYFVEKPIYKILSSKI